MSTDQIKLLHLSSATMIRQTSSRNQRNKGRRVKNVLKLCAMVVVCFWLLYQLKHSYNRKSTIDERISKTPINAADGKSNFLKLGRKELRQREEIHSEYRYNIEDENKEAEEEEDQEVKEAIEDLDRGGLEDDEIDVQDHDRDDDDDEAENGDEVANEEDKKDYDEYTGELELPDDQDHEDGSHDAHEENDRKDDSSGAAQQEDQETKAKDENGSIENKLKETIEETVADKKDAPKVNDNSLKSSNVSVTAGNMEGNGTISSNELMIVDDGSAEKKGSEVPYNRIDRFVPENQVVSQINSIGSSWSESRKLQTVNLSFQHGNLNSSSAEDQKIISNSGSPKEFKHVPDNRIKENAEKTNRTSGSQNLKEH